MMSIVRLKKEHYDKKSKLEQFIEYYDCPVCFNMKENIVECPHCKSRACVQCAEDFSKAEHTKNPAFKAEGVYKCMICHKVSKQLAMHKFLLALLQELRFKCPDCSKTMAFGKLKIHKGRGECVKDGLGEIDEDVQMAEFQPNAVQNRNLVKSLFVFERDSKFIHEYTLQTKTLSKRTVEAAHAFPHNFQSV